MQGFVNQFEQNELSSDYERTFLTFSRKPLQP